jgi:hypothetical protein
MQVGKYSLENAQKVEDSIRAVGDKNEDALLAEYDRRGGLMREEVKQDGGTTLIPVPLGTFWDFAKSEARSKPLTSRPTTVLRKKAKGKK